MNRSINRVDKSPFWSLPFNRTGTKEKIMWLKKSGSVMSKKKRFETSGMTSSIRLDATGILLMLFLKMKVFKEKCSSWTAIDFSDFLIFTCFSLTASNYKLNIEKEFKNQGIRNNHHLTVNLSFLSHPARALFTLYSNILHL